MRSAMEPAEVRAQKAARAGPGGWRQGGCPGGTQPLRRRSGRQGGVCLCHVGRMSEEAGSARN